MKKNKIILNIIITTLIIILIIGGGFYMKSKKEQKIISVEKKSVKVLKQTFSNISKIEFEKSVYDNITGTYGLSIILTNQSNKKLAFNFTFSENPGKIINYVILDDSIQKEGVTSDKVKVIFSNGKEELL